MILRRGKEAGRLAVAQGVQRNLHAFQQFLDDDPASRRPEFLLDQHVVDGLVRLRRRMAEQDAFAQGQPIRFDRALAAKFGGEIPGRAGLGENLRARGRNAMSLP